jgi:vanillate O-demethylase monooxygenase subunit
LQFNAGGVCIGNSFSDKVPNASVRSFPVVEQDGIVWFWPGEGEQAQHTPVPDFARLFVEGQGSPLTGLVPMKAPYEFGTDNLMDLSHIEFVHKGSFAGRGVIFAGEHSVVAEGNRLHSNWWMPGVPAPGHTFGIYEPSETCEVGGATGLLLNVRGCCCCACILICCHFHHILVY